MRSTMVAVFVAATCARGEYPVEYNRDVRPILAENCFACHGPDSAARKADLRLDRREDAIKAGVLSPGKPADSELVRRVLADDAETVMPPPKAHKALKPEQKKTLERWIKEGAEYQPHWSFIPPKRPAVPEVKDKAWVKTPVDAFVLAALETRGLTPAPPADRRTLARRLSLDMTGLPPEPSAVRAFVDDQSPNAVENYIDALMKSPHWGEHRGRYWLDAARYADTHGIHFDNYREMWSYRDWVIGAFNRNLPFDTFTREQLAGDLLPDRTLDQQIASGFNRCNITTNEGGAIAEEYLVLYNRDRTETAAQVWLGLTAGCAVCHDHKFDPLSQKEFYALAAFFNNTTQAAMDGNIANTPPVVPVPRPEDRERFEALGVRMAAAREAVDARKKEARPDFDKWLAGVSPAEAYTLTPTKDLRLHAPLDEGDGKATRLAVEGQVRTLRFAESYAWVPAKEPRKGLIVRAGANPVEVPDAGDFDRDQPFTVSLWVRNDKRGQTGALVSRMDNADAYRGWDVWVQNDRVGIHFVHKWPGDAAKVVAKGALPHKQWVHVTVASDGSGKASGLRVYYDGEPQALTVEADRLQGTTRTAVPLKLGQRSNGERVQNVALADLRVYSRALSAGEAAQLAKSSRASEILAKPAAERSAPEKDELFAWWLVTNDGPYRDLEAKLNAVVKEEAALKARGTVAHVMQEKPGMPVAFVLHRGEYDRRRDKVLPDTPAILPTYPAELPKNRLGLAEWLLRPDHPLTARVTVNRFWQELFGSGLVRTSGDFGITGELPSHPELLDWLAVEFRESGWDVKRFFKMLAMSSCYQQTAVSTPEKRAKDAENRLLSRGPRFRMDAEMVRDHALAASGILVPKLGGRSVKPYQPEGVWEAVAMIGSDTRDYKQDKGEALYRRSLYTFWKRSAPPASMEILNAPNRETCAVRRERTNTPLQALVTLNDVQFVEAARFLAQRALKEASDDRGRVDYMTERLIARKLRDAEYGVLLGSLEDLRTHYKDKPADAAKLIAVGESKPDASLDPATLAAWTMLANQLMNLDEVLNK